MSRRFLPPCLIKRAAIITLSCSAGVAAHGEGLGIFVRVLPTCVVRTMPSPVTLSCGGVSTPGVRLMTGNGAQAYAGSSLMEATRVARATSQLGGATYVIIDF